MAIDPKYFEGMPGISEGIDEEELLKQLIDVAEQASNDYFYNYSKDQKQSLKE